MKYYNGSEWESEDLATPTSDGLMPKEDKATLDGASQYGKEFLANADAETARTNLGLSAGAVANIGTSSELNSGTQTSSRVWAPKTIVDYVKTNSAVNLNEAKEYTDNVQSESKKYTDISMTPVNPYSSLSGFQTHEQSVTKPYLYDEITAVKDLNNRMIDGARFFTFTEVGSRPGTWIDKYYGYVSGHGGYVDPLEKGYTWLVTAPHPYGPWTFYETPILGTGSLPHMESHVVGPRCIAPDVRWVDNKLHINYHGGRLNEPWVPGYDYTKRWGAPSALATSTNGINFTEVGIEIDIDKDVNNLSPYTASTSYRRTVLDNGIYRTVWQANTTWNNEQADAANYSVGYAISRDGVKWVKQKPLITAYPGDQGPFGPSIVKIPGGWLAVTTYRFQIDGGQDAGKMRMWFSPDLTEGSFRDLGEILLPERENRAQKAVQSPYFFYLDNILHIAYGSVVNPSEKAVISIAKVGWE